MLSSTVSVRFWKTLNNKLFDLPENPLFSFVMVPDLLRTSVLSILCQNFGTSCPLLTNVPNSDLEVLY